MINSFNPIFFQSHSGFNLEQRQTVGWNVNFQSHYGFNLNGDPLLLTPIWIQFKRSDCQRNAGQLKPLSIPIWIQFKPGRHNNSLLIPVWIQFKLKLSHVSPGYFHFQFHYDSIYMLVLQFQRRVPYVP